MSRAGVRATLFSELRNFTTGRGIPVAVENRIFTPSRLPYLMATLMISSEQAAELGLNADEQIDGIFQISIVCDSNAGTQQADALSDAIKTHFARRTLHGENCTIKVRRVMTRLGVSSDKTYMLPLDVEFRAYANINTEEEHYA